MGKAAISYNGTHSSETVLAAINGDPWIVYHTDYDGDGVYKTGKSVKHVSVSRGLMIIDGEIWATRQTDDENYLARNDNVERGTQASLGPVFALTADGDYIIGKPLTSIGIVNNNTSYGVAADGINRLPAPNSLMIYNWRVGKESMAYSDAYEIYLKCSDTAFRFSSDLEGTVTHIFESGDTSARPTLDENTVVLSARGSAIAKIKGQFRLGQTVSVSCTVTSDELVHSQKNVWDGVTQAIAGFFTMVENGVATGQPGNTNNYPCSIIGLREDGSVLFLSVTATIDGNRSSCRMQELPELCIELGMRTAILLDGGGSTTMVTLSDGAYVRRSSAVDGVNKVRDVINGIAVVYKGIDINVKNSETENRVSLNGYENDPLPPLNTETEMITTSQTPPQTESTEPVTSTTEEEKTNPVISTESTDITDVMQSDSYEKTDGVVANTSESVCSSEEAETEKLITDGTKSVRGFPRAFIIIAPLALLAGLAAVFIYAKKMRRQ
jgi:hypothetical protein